MPLRHQLVLLLIAFVALPASAQFRIRNGMVDVPASTNKPSVYVRDSAVAAEKLALAQRMERLKEWNKSADVYQEIVEKYADRVVPADVPADAAADATGVTRYTSVTLKVQTLLGKWPAEGLQVYRGRYETPAQTLLDAADVDDVAALSQVVQRYFPTDAARKAALRLMELYIEEGEFSAAAWLGERLLVAHPALAGDEANVLFRTVLAEHLAGNDQAAKAKAEELKQKFADTPGVFVGRDVKLADEAAKIIASPPPTAHGVVADSWPMFGGDASRSRVPQSSARPGARTAEIPLIVPRTRQDIINAELRRRQDTELRGRRDQGLSLTLMPVVDRGELFYRDASRIYAVSVDSGLPLPGWSLVYGEQSNKRFVDPQAIAPGTGQASLTVTDSAVLAVFGQTSRSVMNNDFGGVMMLDGGDTQLLCVDRANGAKKWSASPAQFPESMANLKSLKLNGSPLVVGDSVYLSARGGNAMQFEDSYVVCFALADGRFRWACYLASGNAPGDFSFAARRASDSATHLAYAGGRVYAVTNLGAVAAIDAYTGTISWLTLYPKSPQVNNPMMAIAAMQAGNNNGMALFRKPWAQNAAIIHDGRVFALPSDSTNLLIYDAATGEEISHMPLSEFDNADTLLGVVSDKLIVSGGNSIYCINWPKYDPTKRKEDNIFWWAPVIGAGTRTEESKDVVRGRGFVTSDSVFIPTKANLRRVSLSTGKTVETYPPSGAAWASGEGPGNVIVSQDQVIIAGNDNIIVYSDLTLARAKLDKAIADAPSDPLPRLKYAETLFAAGQIDDAVAKLDDAINLLGGLNSMRPGPERDRVFARALTFAERSADPKVGAPDIARVASLFDRAAAAASSPPQQVSWRISRAHFAHDRQDFDAEVRLYQDILSDPKLRGVNVPSDDRSGVMMASIVAESAIKERLRSTPAAYAPFERAAKEALAAAKQSKDAAQVLAVAQTYPNATVASEAMFVAADAFEAAGQYRPAVQTLNQLYRKYRDTADKARILEAQARNYLMLPGGVGVAIGHLTEGAKIGGPQLSKPLRLPDNSTIENVSFGAAAELLQKYSADLATAMLPEFNLPVWKGNQKPPAFFAPTPEMQIADVDRLLMPPPELRKFSRYDRVVTWTASPTDKASGAVGIYAVGTNTPLAVNSTVRQTPTGALWIGNDLLVWSAQKLSLLRGNNAASAWEIDISGVAPVEIASGEPEPPRRPLPVNQQRQQQVIIGPNGIIVDNQVVQLGGARVMINRGARVVVGGAVQQRPQRGGGEEIDHVRPVGDRVVLATSTGRLIAVELGNGEVAWQTRLTDAPFQRIVTSDDFVAVHFSDDTGSLIAALETFTGQIVWRRSFTPENGQLPVNMALSPDGTLVFSMPDRLCGVDLYEPGKNLKFGDKAVGDGSQMFAGGGRWDQLMIAEGRILAVADAGQSVRIISPDKGNEIAPPLPTKSNNWNVGLRVVGPRVYVINGHVPLAYSLDHPEEFWEGSPVSHDTSAIRDAFVGKRHLVLLDQPDTPAGAEPAASASHFRLLAYARYPRSASNRGESGKLDQFPDVTSPADIDQWQPVQGGFYYHSTDRQARFLKGFASGT